MSPTCSACGTPTVPFAVPDALRAYAPDESEHAALCPHCLRIAPVDDGTATPDFAAVHAQFPDGEGGIAMALVVGLLDSLALHRSAIEALCLHAERAGVDPLVTVEMLADVDGLDPHFDLPRRLTQLEQLLS